MDETLSLFEAIFGPHKLKFKTVNKCVVVGEVCVPTLVYNKQFCE